MKKLLLLTVLALVTGCVDRIPVYSPRQTDTEAHREARAPEDCLDCHDLSKLSNHSPTDDCTRCHKISKGN